MVGGVDLFGGVDLVLVCCLLLWILLFGLVLCCLFWVGFCVLLFILFECLLVVAWVLILLICFGVFVGCLFYWFVFGWFLLVDLGVEFGWWFDWLFLILD